MAPTRLGALLVSAGERLGAEVHALDSAPEAAARKRAARFAQGGWNPIAPASAVMTVERDDVSADGEEPAQRQHHAARGPGVAS